MTHLAEHAVPASARPRGRTKHMRAACVVSGDIRWPAVVAALRSLRIARRRSVRIVDADCGSGELLLCAARQASALGFTAIEARGIDDALALVDRARAAAAAVHDPAIGISFEFADLASALATEADFPADIVLWHRDADCGGRIGQAVTAAGKTVIADRVVAAEAVA